MITKLLLKRKDSQCEEELKMIMPIRRWVRDRRNKVVNAAGQDLGGMVWHILHRIGVRDVFIELNRVDGFTTDTIGIKLPTDYKVLKDLMLFLIGAKVHGLLDATGEYEILWLTYY